MVPWKYYTKLVIESVASFYIATFCIAVFFLHQGDQFVLLSALQVVLYAVIVAMILLRIWRGFSAPALMLTVPIAPLLVLIIVVTMLPILERLR